MNVEDLNVVGLAHIAAERYAAAFPGAVFTSGRRDLKEQSYVMARHTVSNRSWIESTYATSGAKLLVCEWLREHPSAQTIDQISAGIFSVLSRLTDAELKHLSVHPAGCAWDTEPKDDGGPEHLFLLQLARELGGTFLDEEGGEKVWHLQFV